MQKQKKSETAPTNTATSPNKKEGIYSYTFIPLEMFIDIFWLNANIVWIAS